MSLIICSTICLAIAAVILCNICTSESDTDNIEDEKYEYVDSMNIVNS
ncbi:hypothetical protein TOT_010000872 [Theileria orientalis strain Shintoku]|uniref:Uncharacterized protein n=1 Tax=Theileria orientalis strain Shintoku TaxID=869250 RepID=J4C2W8_THEOR|nr:hypothetical protein TOT_010000872 [Theileria orientalis strain Shintoku]PVC53339.1 hypothetical protein MACL_00000145 [Theileria orientalis]BAM39416.1 hypothetical protein TOT_010000872 [Theileria orientalis strain Shintoku]|eukprot:XP_009689717.1 hypothetical protein TOT_010000872 [Theileria orientalis strain Shintoku]